MVLRAHFLIARTLRAIVAPRGRDSVLRVDDDSPDDDRAAILARRRRFIALAISGLATTGCKAGSPEPCLSVIAPDEPADDEDVDAADAGANGPFVEEPGTPLETGETETGETETGATETEMPGLVPSVCLNFAAPQPCLEVAPKPRPKPKPCLKKSSHPQPCLLMAPE